MYPDDSLTLHTDLYQINMMQVYFRKNIHNKRAIFEVYFLNNRALRSENLLHSRGVARSGFPPIAEDSLLLPPVGVWAVSQSQCGRSPSQVGYVSLPW